MACEAIVTLVLSSIQGNTIDNDVRPITCEIGWVVGVVTETRLQFQKDRNGSTTSELETIG